MVKKTHTQGGYIVGLTTNPIMINATLQVDNFIYRLILTCIYIYGAYFGSLLPDIDLKNSYISKRMPLVYKVFGSKQKHRGFTHSMLSVCLILIICKVIFVVSKEDKAVGVFSAGIWIGYVSHILLDMFTKEGVEFFYPLRKTICFTKMKTSSYKERKLNKILQLGIYMLIGMNVYATFMCIDVDAGLNNYTSILKIK